MDESPVVETSSVADVEEALRCRMRFMNDLMGDAFEGDIEGEGVPLVAVVCREWPTLTDAICASESSSSDSSSESLETAGDGARMLLSTSSESYSNSVGNSSGSPKESSGSRSCSTTMGAAVLAEGC